jgi:hypothetical protein
VQVDKASGLVREAKQRGLAGCHAFSCDLAAGLLREAHANKVTDYDPPGEMWGPEPPLHAGNTWWAPHLSVSGVGRGLSMVLGSSCHATGVRQAMDSLVLRGLGCSMHGMGWSSKG